MGNLAFTDGVTIETSGPLRKLHLYDGWYVVGNGSLSPCKNEEDADTELKGMLSNSILGKETIVYG